VSIFTARDRIASFQRRLELWEKNVDKRQYDCSAVLNDFLMEAESTLEENVYGNIIQNLMVCIRPFRILPVFYRWGYLGPKSILHFRETGWHVCAKLRLFDRYYI
jgi:hypothetical protein